MGKDLKGKELGKGLSQRKDKRYVGRFTDRFGNRPEIKDFDLNVVKKALAKAIYEDSQKLNVCDSTMTLDEWYQKWITVYKYGLLKQNTKCNYVNHYRKHIKPILGRRKLNDITNLQIKALINDMDKDGYGYEMKNRTRILLVDMFNKAMVDGFVNRNPAKGIKIIREEDTEPRVMTQEEQSIFFDCCKGTFYDNLFVVCVNTGLRPGEATALTEKNLDFDRKIISVTNTLIYQKWESDDGKTLHLDTPKTAKSVREIPMNSRAETALKKQILQKRVMVNRYGDAKCGEEFKDILFTTKFNTPVIEQVFIDAIDRIIDEINSTRDVLDEFERITPHCFRHTFATRCIESGMKPKVLQTILGHANLDMTMNLYAHVLPNMKNDEMDLLESEMKKLDDMDVQITERRYEQAIIERNKIVAFNAV